MEPTKHSFSDLLGARYLEKTDCLEDGLTQLFALAAAINGSRDVELEMEILKDFDQELKRSSVRELTHEAIYSGKVEILDKVGDVYTVLFSNTEYLVGFDIASTINFLKDFHA